METLESIATIIIFGLIVTINIGIIFLITYIITSFAYSTIRNKIQKDTARGIITDYNKLLLNINNKISNIEKDIKELKENNKKEE